MGILLPHPTTVHCTVRLLETLEYSSYSWSPFKSLKVFEIVPRFETYIY